MSDENDFEPEQPVEPEPTETPPGLEAQPEQDEPTEQEVEDAAPHASPEVPAEAPQYLTAPDLDGSEDVDAEILESFKRFAHGIDLPQNWFAGTVDFQVRAALSGKPLDEVQKEFELWGKKQNMPKKIINSLIKYQRDLTKSTTEKFGKLQANALKSHNKVSSNQRTSKIFNVVTSKAFLDRQDPGHRAAVKLHLDLCMGNK